MRQIARLISVVLGVGVCCIALTERTFGDPVLLSVNATYLDTDFSASGGTYSKGVLTVSDEADIVVEYVGEQVTYDNGSYSMITSLFTDNSTGGHACGSDSQDLLTGDVICLQLDEVPNQPGLLAGTGRFAVTGGSLESDFAMSQGDVVQLSFLIDLADISDFSTDFSGVSNVTLMPVAEPGTLALLGSAALVLL